MRKTLAVEEIDPYLLIITERRWSGYETRVYDMGVRWKAKNKSQWRYETEQEALEGHARAIDVVRRELGDDDLPMKHPSASSGQAVP